MGRSPSPEAKRQRREERERGRDYDRERSRRDDRDSDRGRDDRRDSDRGRDRDRDRARRDEGRTADRDKMRHREGDESRGREEVTPSSDRKRRNQEPESKPASRTQGGEPKPASPNTRGDIFDPQYGEAGSISEEKPKDGSIMLMEAAEAALEAKDQAKEKASFEYTGKLAVETNKVNGIALQFTEPPEARKPTVRWRLYVFKDGEPLDEPILIHRQSCYLFGRERKIADIPIDHPSCSKQHAVIQYRLVENEIDGSKRIRPYLMDLGSTNKTFLNGEPLDSQRYYELLEKDAIKFGNSSREYILLHENSAS